LVPVLFIFYIQGVLKLKINNSGAERLITSVGASPPPNPSGRIKGKIYLDVYLRPISEFSLRQKMIKA
jgi:hypothetical protein